MSDEHVVEDRLLSEKPAPAPGFRGELARMVAAARPGRHRPSWLWPAVAATGLGGVALLAVALVGYGV
jgi:hypothetical protein